MSRQYSIQEGKLVVSNASSFPLGLKVFLFLLCTLLAAGGGFAAAWKYYALPENSHVISMADLQSYKEIERTLNETLEKNLQQKEFILDEEKLKAVFAEVFPEVRIEEKLLNTYIAAVSTWGAEHSIPPLLLLSIIWRESSFDASTVSSANARGPMQVIYKYHTEKLKRIGKGEMSLHDIDTGVRIGTEIMREYFDRFDQDIFRTMRAYVGGTHKTYAQDILTRYFRARMYMEEHYGTYKVGAK